MITKYMVIVETKNYPINTIFPVIQRYSRIKKKMNASEIATCLACFANVTLVKYNGTQVRLTANNFKQTLIDYGNEVNTIETSKAMRQEEKRNTAKIDELKASTSTDEPTSAPTGFTARKAVSVIEEATFEFNGEQTSEVEQEDPEDEDTFDSSPFYETDED